MSVNSDDAEEKDGSPVISNAKLRLGQWEWTGLCYLNLTIPKNATITNAYVELTSETDKTEVTSLTIYGQANDNPSTFTTAATNISVRPRTAASVAWSNVPAWSTGQKYQSPEIKNIVQEIVTRAGWVSGNSLVIIIKSDDPNGNRIAWAHDGSTPNAALLHVEYVTGPNLLFVVTNPASLTTQETARQTLLHSWNYRVSLIAASATQATYDSAAATNDVAYVSANVDPATLGTKLKTTPLGVVNEQASLADEFSLATSQAQSSGSSLNVLTIGHYITAPFSVGSLSLFNTSQPVTSVAGSLAPRLQVLGQWGSSDALVTLEAGETLQDSSIAAGRRVNLPWGGTAFDIDSLTIDGRTLLLRALEWSGGRVGHWKLDETTGTAASDSSAKPSNGTLTGGSSFNNDSVSPAKVDRGLRFDGLNDHVSIANATKLQVTSALTISAWIQGDAWSSGANVSSILRKGSAETTNYQLAIADGKVTLYLDAADAAGIRGNTVLATNQWYHVAATWDGTTVRIYVDGQLDNTPALKTGSLGTDTSPLYIGGTPSGDVFDGVIDDVRLLNHALGPDEIASLHGSGSAAGVRIIQWVEVP